MLNSDFKWSNVYWPDVERVALVESLLNRNKHIIEGLSSSSIAWICNGWNFARRYAYERYTQMARVPWVGIHITVLTENREIVVSLNFRQIHQNRLWSCQCSCPQWGPAIRNNSAIDRMQKNPRVIRWPLSFWALPENQTYCTERKGATATYGWKRRPRNERRVILPGVHDSLHYHWYTETNKTGSRVPGRFSFSQTSHSLFHFAFVIGLALLDILVARVYIPGMRSLSVIVLNDSNFLHMAALFKILGISGVCECANLVLTRALKTPTWNPCRTLWEHHFRWKTPSP